MPRLLRPTDVDHWSWQDTKRHWGALGWSSEPSVSCDACRPLTQDSAAEVLSSCAKTPQNHRVFMARQRHAFVRDHQCMPRCLEVGTFVDT